MTTVWNPKDPNETVWYEADWSDEIGGDESLISYTMTITSGTATISSQQQKRQSVRFLITGGTDGASTEFLHRVTTSTGQILERTYSLFVSEGVDVAKPATTTKRMLLEQAFSECALNGWEYDISAEEKDTALHRLDMLMWELVGRGLNLNYNFPTVMAGGDLDDALGCPDQAYFGLAVLLAERLCPTMGKTQSKESRIILATAIKAVRNAAGPVPSMLLAAGTPIGSGNKPWSTRYPFSMTR